MEGKRIALGCLLAGLVCTDCSRSGFGSHSPLPAERSGDANASDVIMGPEKVQAVEAGTPKKPTPVPEVMLAVTIKRSPFSQGHVFVRPTGILVSGSSGTHTVPLEGHPEVEITAPQVLGEGEAADVEIAKVAVPAGTYASISILLDSQKPAWLLRADGQNVPVDVPRGASGLPALEGAATGPIPGAQSAKAEFDISLENALKLTSAPTGPVLTLENPFVARIEAGQRNETMARIFVDASILKAFDRTTATNLIFVCLLRPELPLPKLVGNCNGEGYYLLPPLQLDSNDFAGVARGENRYGRERTVPMGSYNSVCSITPLSNETASGALGFKWLPLSRSEPPSLREGRTTDIPCSFP